MAQLTREDVLKLARLARLDLTDEEVEEFAAELSDVLRFFEQLQKVDVTGLQPTAQVSGLQNVMRADEVKDYGVSPEDLLHGAPQTQDGHIKVRRMIV